MASVLNDSEIVKSIRRGETAAFAVLVERYQTKVRAYCGHLLLNPTDGDDAAQEIFLKIFRHLDQFRGDSSFSTWLYQISVNHCRDILRNRKRQNTEFWEDLQEHQKEALLARNQQPGLNETMENRDLALQILSTLSVEYREVLVLREARDLSYDEIAQALDCSVDAVKGRLKRARAELLVSARHFVEESDVTMEVGIK